MKTFDTFQLVYSTVRVKYGALHLRGLGLHLREKNLTIAREISLHLRELKIGVGVIADNISQHILTQSINSCFIYVLFYQSIICVYFFSLSKCEIMK